MSKVIIADVRAAFSRVSDININATSTVDLFLPCTDEEETLLAGLELCAQECHEQSLDVIKEELIDHIDNYLHILNPIIKATGPVNGGYTVIPNSNGGYTMASGTLTNHTIAATEELNVKQYHSSSPDLPEMILRAPNITGGPDITMVLKPEQDIAPRDCMKITQMLFCYQINMHIFNAFEYVKKHNLERHFTFS